MMSNRKNFALWTYPEDIDLRNYLESKANISEFIKKIVNDFRIGKLTQTKNSDLQRKKLEIDIRYKEIMCKIKLKELEFSETFEKPPPYSAKQAIKVNVNTESYEPPEEKKIQNIIETKWNKFVNTLKKDSKGEWVLTCKLCNTGFILPTKETAIIRFKTHLLETHNEKVLD